MIELDKRWRFAGATYVRQPGQ